MNRMTMGVLVALSLAAGVALAAPLTIFQPDTPARAVEVNANFASVKPPAGSIVAYAGATAPEGWLFCEGQTFDATQFPELAAALGTRYGGTAGMPRVPDLAGRVIVGLDVGSSRVTGALADTLGEPGGVDVNTTVPAHTHAITSEPAHNHPVSGACNNATCGNFNDGFTRGSGNLDPGFRTGTGGAHNHGGATGSTGSPGVTNLQPFLTLRYLIKT